MKKNGFTLVELLTIISVIGIIMLVTIPTIVAVMDRSKDNSYRDSVRTLFKSIQVKITEDRTLTTGDISFLDFNDHNIVSGTWEYDEATNNIILKNIVFSDSRMVCRLEHRERSEDFPIYESCPD